MKMSSAKKVADTLIMKGKHSKMSKWDMRNAYKIVPCKEGQLRLNGFFWLGMYWIETRQVFGSISAVYNYDILHFCVSLLARLRSKIDGESLHRTLDDQVCVTDNDNLHEAFRSEYKLICKRCDIPLSVCDGVKAFEFKTRGTVLGIDFDAETLSWTLSSEKISRYLSMINELRCCDKATLKQIQRVNGVINTIVIHCPILQFFRTEIIDALKFANKRQTSVVLDEATRKLLLFWMHVLHDLRKDFPIVHRNFSDDLTSVLGE